MTNNEFVKYSPEEIFEIFKEQHRLASPLDPEADESYEITKETTVSDLQCAQDLLPWKEWTEWLNSCYGIDATKDEWKNIVKPISKKTIWEVSHFISERADKELIKPIKILGTECLSAAVFLTIKKNLKKKGVDIGGIRPSTNIEEYLNDNDENFSALIEEATLTGVHTFDELSYGELKTERVYKKWLDNFLPNFFYERPLKTGDIKTFRDLVNRIIENKKLGTTLTLCKKT